MPAEVSGVGVPGVAGKPGWGRRSWALGLQHLSTLEMWLL